MEFINTIKGMFKHKVETIDIDSILPDRDDIDIYIPQQRLISIFDPSKPSILLIDDSKGIIQILEEYMSECGINTSNYNILTFFGMYAPFVMQKTLIELKQHGLTKIDAAVIDIVLPGKIRIDDKFVKLDGVDVSIYLNKEFECSNLCFYTGNITNSYVDFISEKMGRFYNHFRKDMKDYVIFKGEDTSEMVIKELFKLLNKGKFEV